MAIYSEARQELLTTRPKVPLDNPVRLNLHTAVTNASSLFGFFQNNEAGTFSHFYVDKEGTVIQYMDTQYRAACDYTGNRSTISVETWDGGTYPIRSWTPEQVESLAKLFVWVTEEHPTIPMKMAVDNLKAGDSSHGLSCHRLGIPGYSKYTESTGGVMFSNSRLKECPGELRISQIPTIFARATELSKEPINVTPQEDELTPEQDAMLKAVYEKLQILEARTPEDLGKEAALQVHRWPINRSGQSIPFIQEIADIKTMSLSNSKTLNEVLTLVKALRDNPPASPGEVAAEMENIISRLQAVTVINIPE